MSLTSLFILILKSPLFLERFACNSTNKKKQLVNLQQYVFNEKCLLSFGKKMNGEKNDGSPIL